MCTASFPLYLSHRSEWVKGLCAPKCGVHLKCPSFPTYDCPLTPSIQMQVIELNNLSAQVNKVVSLSLSL